MLDKIIKIVSKLINFVMIIFFLLLILIGGYALFDSYMVYDETKLDDEILTLKPKSDENFNFDAVKKINKDAEGWITIFGTSIDYPVLHSKDNQEYLNLDYKKNYTTGGSIFTDYRNKPDFADDYTIIYGHNMSSGQMFADIKKYENTDYFNQHLHGALYTTHGVYKIEIISLAKVNAFKDDVYNLITYANGKNQELVKLMITRAIKTHVIGGFDKLILLSTCDSFGSNDRAVLLARLVKTDNLEIAKLDSKTKPQNDKKTAFFGGFMDTVLKNKCKILVVILLIIILILLYIIFRQRKEKTKKTK